MSRTVAFAYPAARLHAQFGRLLGDAQWERLERLPDYVLFVQAARDTALRPWVQSLGPATEPHRIEAQLREQFRQRVRAVAAWCPREWRDAVLWVRHLADLPASAHVLEGRPAPAWLAAEPALAQLRTRAIRRGELAGVPIAAWQAGTDLPEAWLRRWHGLWPAVTARERASVGGLVARLRSAARGELTREALVLQLRRTFRRHDQAPAGVFAALALAWLELARLRGALMRRRLLLPVMELAA